MSLYARNTHVSPERTRDDIERELRRYGATGFQYGWQGPQAIVAFVMHERLVRFTVMVPDGTEDDIRFVERRGKQVERTTAQIAALVEQINRQRWRGLLLSVKAKLDAVLSGQADFETEFLGNLVLQDGRTIAEHLKPQLAKICAGKSIPPLLGHRDLKHDTRREGD